MSTEYNIQDLSLYSLSIKRRELLRKYNKVLNKYELHFTGFTILGILFLKKKMVFSDIIKAISIDRRNLHNFTESFQKMKFLHVTNEKGKKMYSLTDKASTFYKKIYSELTNIK